MIAGGNEDVSLCELPVVTFKTKGLNDICFYLCNSSLVGKSNENSKSNANLRKKLDISGFRI